MWRFLVFKSLFDLALEDLQFLEEYKVFLMELLPFVIQRCHNEILKDEGNKTHFVILLNIVYESVLLFFKLSLLTDKNELLYCQNLFGNKFQLEKDLQEFRSDPRRNVNGTFLYGLNPLEFAVILQVNQTASLKFQKIKPHLKDLLLKFENEKIYSKNSDIELIDIQLTACRMVLWFLEKFIDPDSQS